MKQCNKCGENKDTSEFYRHPQNSDGLFGKCKTCTKRDVRENRRKRAEYYREYDRQRAMTPDRVAARKEYLNTEEGRAAARRAKDKYHENNPTKRKAHHALNNAVRDGKVVKPDSCSECGAGGIIHGHHDDYAKPLEVRWLCTTCHKAWHDENGEGANP